jgi:hypothetical protein
MDDIENPRGRTDTLAMPGEKENRDLTTCNL